MAVLPQYQIRILEEHLHNYQSMKIEVQQWREFSSNPNECGKEIREIGNFSVVPREIASLGSLPAHIQNKMDWVTTIDKVAQRFQGTTGELVLQVWYGQPHQTVEIACQKIPLTPRNFAKWRERIVLLTALYAIQFGLLKIA